MHALISALEQFAGIHLWRNLSRATVLECCVLSACYIPLFCERAVSARSPDPAYHSGPFPSPITWRAGQCRALCQRLSLGLCRALACYSRMLLRTRPGRASKAKLDHSAAHLRQTKWFPCLKPKASSPHVDTSSRGSEGMVKPHEDSQSTGVAGQVPHPQGPPPGPEQA